MFRRTWKKVSDPILAALKQGLSPEKAALAVALGAWIGVIPVLGGTMALCALAAWALGLNQVIIQVANYAVYPLQFILLFPFFGAGAWLFGGPSISLSAAEFAERAANAPVGLIREFLWVGIHATVVWALLMPLAVGILWFVFRALFTRVVARQAAAVSN
jgi:uncharacterized protein (DUF2062 family)